MRVALLVLLTIRLLPQYIKLLFIKPLLCNLLVVFFKVKEQKEMIHRSVVDKSLLTGVQSQKISLLNLLGSNTYPISVDIMTCISYH